MPEDFLNIRHMRVVVRVAETGSVTLAAARENLSQPAVTQAIARIEAELGVTLFERRRDGFRPTPVGAGVLSRLSAALAQLATGAKEAIQAGNPRAGRGFAEFDRLFTHTQLTALLAMARSTNFSMAARDLGISQPSVYRTARNLESLSGLKLFDTDKTRVILTPAARALARRAQLARTEIRQARDEINLHLGRITTQIAIGSLPLSRTRILPDAIDRMIRAAPGVQVRSVDGPYPELLAALRHGDLDCTIGALRDPAPAEDVVQEKLFDDPLAIVVGAGHPLARVTAPRIDDLLSFPWIAPPRETPAGRYLFHFLRIGERDQTPVRVISSSLVLVRGLLMAGDYVTIISPHQISVERAQGLLVPLDIDLPDSARPIGLTTRSDWRPTPTQARFIDFLRDAARDRQSR